MTSFRIPLYSRSNIDGLSHRGRQFEWLPGHRGIDRPVFIHGNRWGHKPSGQSTYANSWVEWGWGASYAGCPKGSRRAWVMTVMNWVIYSLRLHREINHFILLLLKCLLVFVKWLLGKWMLMNSQWQASLTRLRMFFPTVASARSLTLSYQVIQALTGHGKFNSYLFKLGLVDCPQLS